ncbi:MAG: hypothetical protein Q4E24_09770, partial [bacterium]|nr:hypothetical protein [bacterium]
MGRLTYENQYGEWWVKGIQREELHEGKTMSKDIYYNGSGYPDPVAAEAIQKADRMPEAVRVLKKNFRDFNTVASLLGFEVVGEVSLKD